MERIAQFEKVSFDEFKSACGKICDDKQLLTDEQYKLIYDSIQLPTRSTKGSAGYDFKSICYFTIPYGKSALIPTGVKVKIDDGWVLLIAPRSSFGFKYRAQLDNTIGVIDSDYYYSDNEGHIMIKMTNDSKEKKILSCEPGDKFVQGFFVPFGITIDDNATGIRNGGIGSTDGKN